MGRVRLVCLFSGMLAATVPLAVGQSTRPATGPAAGGEPSPKAAVKTFVTAQIKGDGPGIRAVLLTTNPTEQRMAGAIADLAVAIAELDKAMVAKFGAAQTEPLMGDPAGALRANMDKLDKAAERVTGDTATVTSAPDAAPAGQPPAPGDPSPQDSMTLRKVDGQWKVSVSDLSKGSNTADVERTLASVDTAVAGYRSVLADLNGGKLTTVDAVAAALNSKLAPAGGTGTPGGAPTAPPIAPPPAK